jgi:hypothetical protein
VLSIEKDKFWESLLVYCKKDHLLVSILYAGSELISRESQKSLPNLVEDINGQFRLKGNIAAVPKSASQLRVFSLTILKNNALNRDDVLSC